jgi:large subunit ribosomal protein L22
MGYSRTIEEKDESKIARVYGRTLRISPKHSVEISNAIRGMKVDEAKEFLLRVQKKKEAVPFRKYKKKVGHKRLSKWYAGRYPVKACKRFYNLLEEAESNAEYKGLDRERLRIIHASAYKGRTFPGYIPRAYGRASPYNHETVNVELIVKEVG